MALFKRSSPEDEADADAPEEEQDEGEAETEETPPSDADADADEDTEDAADEDDDEAPAAAAADDDHDDEADKDQDEDSEESAPQKRKRPVALLGAIGSRVVAVAKWRGMIPISLFLIFFLALFLRAYFYAPEACPTYLPDCQYLLSGNDPDYHKRAIDHLDATKSWLTWDWLQNYPQGGPNPNPPAFETSGLLLGYGLTPFAPNSQTAIWWAMEVIGALWSSLIVFPVYFVGKEMFGRRAGLLGAFFLAVMAGNIERNVLGFSDHDGYLMFFIACGFYYFIKAMEHTKNRTYVNSYTDLNSVTSGLFRFLREQRVAVLYTLMASTMWGACALGWKGFPYIFAIILVYYFVTVISLRWFRHEDPFAIGILTMIAFAWVMVMTLPYYYGMHFMHWYEIFFLLWAAAALITLFFIPTRNLPWVLIFLTLALLVGGTFVTLSVLAPDVADAVFSGGGYFSRNKLYGTIAEAQPPDVSRLLSSYGYWTSLLALGGIGVMAARLPRRWSNAYVLMLAWAAMAIYMALTAVRFMYNATPLFAILAGWMLWGVIDRTHFSLKMYKDRWSKYISWRKIRTVPVHHWAVAYFVAFMVLMPNFMQGLDAGIPFESKKEWDTAIYNFMPDLQDPLPLGTFHPITDLHVFRPGPDVFNVSENKLWYLGSFGTSFMNDYWAVSMKWLAQQDRELPEAQRPGFISWWDYGHWAMHVGEHPTAADNFQNGFEFAGNFIGASGEDAGNSLILARFLETVRDNPKVVELAKKYLGPDGFAEFERYAADPTSFNATILANPDKYMKRDPPISPRNAFYILVSALITERVTPEDRIWWIRDIKQQTGFELRYFAVDVRMMPFTASNTGIFYAPIILADFDKDSFVEIQCTLTNGRTINCDDMTPREYRTLASTQIVYKDNFYKSMFLRAYLGFSSKDIPTGGYNGLPGLRSSCDQAQQQSCLSNSPPMQGYNMSHWRLVQRTVYFNPNASDLSNHTSDWKIITDQEADQYEGNPNVTVDRQFLGLGESSGTGVTYLKYYAGAWVNGTVRTATGLPVPGARVTVYDDVKLANPGWVGIPHGFSYADENGSFSALVPFGNVTLIASTGGGADPFQLKEQIEVGRAVVSISDDQAMRIDQDLNGDGRPDYNVLHDIVGVPGSVRGRAYLDQDGSGSYSVANDAEMGGAILEFNGSSLNVTRATMTEVDGSFDLQGMIPGLYDVNITWGGHRWAAQTGVRVASNASTPNDFVVAGGTVSGTATDELGHPRANATLTLTDVQTGVVRTNLSDETGAYAFRELLSGNYTLTSALINATPFEVQVVLAPGAKTTYNFTAADTVGVQVRAYLDSDNSGNFTAGEEAAGGDLEVSADAGGFFNLTGLDSAGIASVRYPAGNYTVRANYFGALGAVWAGSAKLEAREGANWTVRLTPGVRLTGTVYRDADGDNVRSDNLTAEPGFGPAEIRFEGGGTKWRVLTRGDGQFDVVLPSATYEVRVVFEGSGLEKAQVAFLTMPIDATTVSLNIALHNGTRVSGAVGYDADNSGSLAAGEFQAGVNLTFTLGTHASEAVTDAAGAFTTWVVDGNWTIATSAPGFAANSTTKLLNIQTPENNTVDLYIEALPRTVQGRIGFDADGDGNITDAEGFAGVTLNFTAERALGPYYNGTNASATTNATGDYQVALWPGHYSFNFSYDRGSGALAHRYEAYNATSGETTLRPLVVPSGDAFTLNLSLRELTHFQGIVCYDADGDNVCAASERPGGATLTVSSGPGPTTFTSAANGSFDTYLRSGLYRLEASADVSGIPVQAFLDINITAPLNLGLLRLEQRLSVTVHSFRDNDENGVFENTTDENLTGPTISFTNVTSFADDFVFGEAVVQLLAGRTYAFRLNERRSESLTPGNPVQSTVLYEAQGNFTFTGTNTRFELPVIRQVQVTGAFYYDRNGDGAYTPSNSEEPVGAFIEFRNASTSLLARRIEAPQLGSYEVFVPRGNYTVSVDHAGFNGTNASWFVNVTDLPPQGGFKLDLKLEAHDVLLAGFTFLDLNLNGRMNAFETGMQVPTLRLFNASNLSDMRDLTVASNGSFNATLKPGTYNLYAAGTFNGTAVAGVAQALVDPIGGTAWANVSLRHAFFAAGNTSYNNTTGSVLPVDAINWTVTGGPIRFTLPQPTGAYNVTLPDGVFSVNASLETHEFGVSMNYTGTALFTLDLANATKDIEFSKLRRYQVNFTYVEELGAVAQGASKNYTVTVRNNGTDNATFDLAAPPAQVPAGWTYNISIGNVSLEIGQEVQFYVLLNTSNQTRAGHNVLQVRATPRNVSGEGGFLDLGVTTVQAWGLSVGPDVQAPADLGTVTNYFVSVENKGNGVDRVAVTFGTLPEGYTATSDRGVPGSELELQPFSTQRVTVSLARQPTSAAAPAGTQFLVHVRSVSDANNTTAGSAMLTVAYAELGLGNNTNATRANEPGRGDLVDRAPMTTPGFEGALAAVAALAAAVGVRRKRRGGT